MDNTIRNCAIARFCAVIALAFPSSILGKISAFCGRCYHDSVTRRAFVAFFSASPKTVYSKLYKALYKFNKLLSDFGARICPVAQESFILHAACAFSSSNFPFFSILLLKK